MDTKIIVTTTSDAKKCKPVLKSKLDDFTYVIIQTGYTSRLISKRYKESFSEMINCYYLDEKYEIEGDEEEQEKALQDKENPVVYIKDELWGKDGIQEKIFGDEQHANYLKDNYIVPMKLNGVICLKAKSFYEILEFQQNLHNFASYCNIYQICQTKIYEHDGKKTIIIVVDAESG